MIELWLFKNLALSALCSLPRLVKNVFTYPELFIGGWDLVLLCSALVQAPFWVSITALALEVIMVPLPGFTFQRKSLKLLTWLFPFILNIVCAWCLLLCVSFLFQEEMTFHFSVGSECPGWAYLHKELWNFVMQRQIPRVLSYEGP